MSIYLYIALGLLKNRDNFIFPVMKFRIVYSNF